MKAALIIASTLLASAPAFADDKPQPEAPAIALPAGGTLPTAYTRAISLQLLTLDKSGMAIQLEKVSPRRPKTSVALSLGGRAGAEGDYSSKTVGIGLEVKRWLRRPLPMTGWYVAARTDLARTTVTDDMEDRAIGKLTTWSAGASTGYRWVLFHKIELTPSIGVSYVVEGGTMSPTTARKAGVIGLTAGWIF
jgi:hypothetical protein